jgi:hypothetical protein
MSEGKEGKQKVLEVFVDNTPKKIAAGKYLVAEFKRLMGVDPSKELEQVVDGKLVPLADTATIDITHNGERFVSHIRRGGSS